MWVLIDLWHLLGHSPLAISVTYCPANEISPSSTGTAFWPQIQPPIITHTQSKHDKNNNDDDTKHFAVRSIWRNKTRLKRECAKLISIGADMRVMGQSRAGWHTNSPPDDSDRISPTQRTTKLKSRMVHNDWTITALCYSPQICSFRFPEATVKIWAESVNSKTFLDEC